MNKRKLLYHGYRFPSEIISHAVWLYHRFCLSFRDVEDLLAEPSGTMLFQETDEGARSLCPTYSHGQTPQLRRGEKNNHAHFNALP
jgi:putative transposase